jgi:hypothetical protein
MSKTLLAVILIFVVSISIICAAFLLADRPATEWVQVEALDLIGNIKDYNGKWVNTTAWLGDSGEYKRTTIYIPIFITVDKTTIIMWVPITDTDYYYAIYKDNSFTHGLLLKLGNTHKDLIGKEVVVNGFITTQRARIDGVEQELYMMDPVNELRAVN